MWKEFARIISEVQPKYVFVENSPMLTSRGLGTVLGDLSEMGFNAEWGVLSAADVGANHKRERIWIVAYTNSIRGRWGNKYKQSKRNSSRKFTGISSETVSRQMAHSNSTQCKGNQCSERIEPEHSDIGCTSWWATEPNVGRVANGVAARVDRLKAIGNGQVPLCAATAFKLLKERLK
jgi:DNA (cytosine-5)-methyltransferase 1